MLYIFRCLAAATAALLLPSTAAFALTADYVGTIGGAKVGMTLYRSNLTKAGPIEGYYFYDKVLKDISLEGETDGKRGITLYAVDASGKKVELFRGALPHRDQLGNFRKDDELSGEIMIGQWSMLGHGKTFPFRLVETGGVAAEPHGNRYEIAGVGNAQAFEEKVRKFRSAVIAFDKKTVASLVSYPVTVSENGKSKVIHSSAQLIKNYYHIFNPSYVRAIKNAVPHNLFVNSRGVMLGETGEVWFDSEGKVCTLNN